MRQTAWQNRNLEIFELSYLVMRHTLDLDEGKIGRKSRAQFVANRVLYNLNRKILRIDTIKHRSPSGKLVL